MQPTDDTAQKGMLIIKVGGNIKYTAKKEYRVDAKKTSNDAKRTFQQKSGKGKTIRNEDKVGGKKLDSFKVKDLLITKVESAGDIFPENTRVFIATQYTRTPSEDELKLVRWAYSIDDGQIIEFKNPYGGVHSFNTGKKKFIKYNAPIEGQTGEWVDETEKKAIIEVNITKELAGKSLTIYAYFVKPNVSVCNTINIIDLRIVISDEIIGYTIQRIFFLNEKKSPGYIVAVYKATLGEIKNGGISKEILSFGVTRDGWQKVGMVGKGSYYLINRAFEPIGTNIYELKNSEFPYKYHGLISYDAFLLTLNGKSVLPAEPLETNLMLNSNVSIDEHRKKGNEAINVFLHISGHYGSKTWYDRLGGSLGCFGYVEKIDIKKSIAEAVKAHTNDEYRKTLTDNEWSKIAKKIHETQHAYHNMTLKLQLQKRSNYQKSITISENDILWEDAKENENYQYYPMIP